MTAHEFSQITVLFADLSGFTALTETHGDDDAADIVARLYALAQTSLGGEARLVKTIGDAVMIVAHQPADAIATALRLMAAMQAEPGFPAGLSASTSVRWSSARAITSAGRWCCSRRC